MMFFFTMVIVNIPISWRKVRGGEKTEWIGYMVDVGRFDMGISMARASWAASWVLDKATEGAVRLGSSEKGWAGSSLLLGSSKPSGLSLGLCMHGVVRGRSAPSRNCRSWCG